MFYSFYDAVLTQAVGCYNLSYIYFKVNQVQSKEDVQLGAIIHKLSRRNELNFELLH